MPAHANTASLLHRAADHAVRYLDSVDQRPVAVDPAAISRLSNFYEPLPEHPTDPTAVLDLLDTLGSPATTATAGGRFFGFVIGGTLPASLAASWLATTWDQDAGMSAICPINATLEEVSRRWLLDLLGLPPESGVGFVTGGTMANFTGLAAARHAVLARAGWDVEARRALRRAAHHRRRQRGEPRLRRARRSACSASAATASCACPSTARGACAPTLCPGFTGPAIVCIQAGNVNTGAFDPAREICAWAKSRRLGPRRRRLRPLGRRRAQRAPTSSAASTPPTPGPPTPTSGSTCPTTAASPSCATPETLRAAMAASAAYLAADRRARTRPLHPGDVAPRARRRGLGGPPLPRPRRPRRPGRALLPPRHPLRRGTLRAAGYDILNDVVLNQVLVSFGTPEHTRRVIAALQADGTCWCGGTVWQGRTAMRISVSSWATTDEDVEKSLAAMLGVARATLTE